MEVILVEKIKGLGEIGAVIKVKDGYARNYLLPRGKALRASKANKDQLAASQLSLLQQDEERKVLAEAIALRLADCTYNIVRQAGKDGKLHGTVSARDIAHAINQGLAEATDQVAPEHVELQERPRYIGLYPINIALHAEVKATVNINIMR